MKAYGLRDKLKLNLPDNHPSKEWVNWWKVEINTVKSKKKARQDAKREIKKLIDVKDKN